MGCPPAQDVSRHQDHNIFNEGDPGDPYKPSFSTGILGGGGANKFTILTSNSLLGGLRLDAKIGACEGVMKNSCNFKSHSFFFKRFLLNDMIMIVIGKSHPTS